MAFGVVCHGNAGYEVKNGDGFEPRGNHGAARGSKLCRYNASLGRNGDTVGVSPWRWSDGLRGGGWKMFGGVQAKNGK